MTKVEVVNLALSELGSALVTTLGDATVPGSHYGELNYNSALDQLLRLHPWSFATKEAVLAQKPSAESEEWAYSYALPSGFVRLTKIIGDSVELNEESFSRDANGIHCDAQPISIQYISNDIQPSDYDPDFLAAFVALLASKLAVPVKQDRSLKQAMREEYEAIHLPRAKAADVREVANGENRGPYRAFARSPFLQSRNG